MQRYALTVTHGNNSGESFNLSEGQTFVIGRGKDSDFHIDDPRASRTHCQITVDAGSITLRDAGSSTGTFVNDSRVEEQTLSAGDSVKIGDTVLEVKVAASQDETTLVDRAFGQPKPQPNVTPLEKLVGTNIEQFHLDDIIARGSSGMVYRATDQKKDRIVAFKILDPDYSGSNEQQERFIRGIKTLAPIRHGNIVRLFSAGIYGPYCWTAMEYVDGESMARVIERIGVSGMLDWQYAYRVGTHIGRALEEAWKHKIVHRNVTPRNILLRSADKVVKLGDLTLAKALEGTLAEHVTRPDELIGDVAYMSPERTRGRENIDGRSDIYGLGATLYALLTGRPPFESASLPETISKIRNESPKSPRDYQLSVPEIFEGVVLRMIAKRPDDRFQAPADLLKDLERIGTFHNLSV